MKKLNKETFKEIYIKVKWTEPEGSFYCGVFRSQFIDTVSLYLYHYDRSLYNQFKKDVGFWTIKYLIVFYFNIKMNEIDRLVDEAIKEFEKEFYEKD